MPCAARAWASALLVSLVLGAVACGSSGTGASSSGSSGGTGTSSSSSSSGASSGGASSSGASSGGASSGGATGGSGSSGASTLSPPSALRVEAVANAPDEMQLWWTAPAEVIDGYLVELKIGGGEFQPHSRPGSLVPADWTGLRLRLAPGTPDLVDYTVRLRSARGGVASTSSNEAVYHHPLNAPKNVAARFDWTEGAPVVRWDRNSSAASAVTIDRTEMDASGRAGPWVRLAVPEPGALAFVDRTATRDRSYWYGVTNVAGAATSASAVSNKVFAGLSPPAPWTVHFDVGLDVVALSISSANPDADGLRLERAPVDASNTPVGPWETVDIGPGVPTSFTDTTWPEDARLMYRASNLRGPVSSPPATWSGAVSTPLYKPAALAAASTADGPITLTWQNRSRVARELEISWAPQGGDSARSIVATLAPSATTCSVGGLGLGYYRLTVMARTPTSTAASSIDYTSPSPPGALTLSSASLPASAATDAALRPDGTWAFLDRSATSLSVFAPGDPWPAVRRTDSVPDTLAGTDPVLASDAQGRPHVVYLATAGDGGDPILTHLWFDGAAWVSEAMYRGPLATGYATPAFEAALDATGTPQALAVLKSGGSPSSAVLVRRGEAGWTTEAIPLPALGGGLDRAFAFGLDAAGNPHLTLTRSAAGIPTRTEYARSGAGAWSSSTMTPFLDNLYPRAAAWIDDQNAVVLVFGLGAGSERYELGVVEKVAGVWQPLRLLGTDRREYGAFPPMRLAATRDGARVAILYGLDVGVRAYHRDAGAWGATLVAPRQSGWPDGFFRAGFDAGGKPRFLVRRDAGGYLDAYEP